MNARKMLAIAGMLTFTFAGAVRAQEVATPLVPPAKTTSETPVLVESLKLETAVFSQPYYRRGEEIELKLSVDSRTATVQANFSAVDSLYRSAAVQVETISGTERVIRYRLSQGNRRPAGTYRVEISQAAASGAPPVKRYLTVDYLPKGPGELDVPGGQFVVGQLPNRENHRHLSVKATVRQDGEALVKKRMDRTKPVELVVTVSSDRRLLRNALKLEVGETRGDGFWRVPVELTAESCSAERCQYQALATVDLAPAGATELDRTVPLTGQLVSAGGAARRFDIPGLGKTAGPITHTHKVSAFFQFQYRDRQPDPASNSPLGAMFPWKAFWSETVQQKAIRHAMVRLEDECGHSIVGATNALGGVSFSWTPVNCGTGTLTVSTFSESQRSAVAHWLNGPINGPGELTGQGEDYRVYSRAVTFDTNAASLATGGFNFGTVVVSDDEVTAKPFYTLDNVMRARDYYTSMPGVMGISIPTIGVVYSTLLRPAGVECDEWDPSGYLLTAFYSPGKHEGFIYVPADSECGDRGWDSHAVIHETSHLFRRHFLRPVTVNDNDYGRFGEGMANVQAAVIRRSKWIATAGLDQVENIDVNSRMACWKNGVLVGDIIDGPNGRAGCEDEGGTVGYPLASFWDNSTTSDGWFQRVVWDLVDDSFTDEPVVNFVPDGLSPQDCAGGGCSVGDFDVINGQGGDGVALSGTGPLNDVLIFYLGGSNAFGLNPHYVDRGASDLDLVDVLDGFVCRGHATVEQIQTLYGAMGFTYDGLGPATCPHPADD